MSEQTGAPATGIEQTSTQTPATGGPPTGVPTEAWNALGDPGKAALTAERDARAAAEKSAADLQAQLDKIAEANLSELEKAQKTAQDASADAATARTEALRYKIASTHGISTQPGEDGKPSDADLFLTGSDEASMTAQAERLAARAPAAPNTPKPDMTQARNRGDQKASPEGDFAAFIGSQLSK